MVLHGARTGVMRATVDIRLLCIVSRTFLTKKGSIHIDAFSRILLLSHSSLKVARNSMVEMGSHGSKKCAFIYDLAFYAILDM